MGRVRYNRVRWDGLKCDESGWGDERGGVMRKRRG